MQSRLNDPLADEAGIPKSAHDILHEYWPVLIAATANRPPILRDAAILPRPKEEILGALKTAFRSVRRGDNKRSIERAILGLAGFVDGKTMPANQRDQFLLLANNTRELRVMIDELGRSSLERCGIVMWLFLAALLGLWIVSVLLKA